MNNQEFEQYGRQMDDDLILHSILDANKINKQAIKIGDITIPADRETFNKMWVAKAFDDIDPTHHLRINPLSLLRTSLHIGRYKWDEYFFMQRENLLHMSARKMWKDSDYYMRISTNTINILTISSKSKIKDITMAHQKKLPSLDSFKEDDDYDNDLTSYYLSGPPEALMFPDVDDDLDNLTIKYSHPVLLKIFRESVLRYQHLCIRSTEERISIYIEEINELYIKIKFIQSLMYSGMNQVVEKFKKIKHNYLQVDPEITEISQEPNEFQEISYKEALYKFYIYCVSPEVVTTKTLIKAHFLGNIVIQYEDINHLVKNYLLPLTSSIKQDKLKSVCCQIILAYLRPRCVTEHYTTEKILTIIK
jgi:hypothetical protein